MLKNQRGQNVVEYVLLLVLIILVLVGVFAPGGFFTRSVEKSLNQAVDGVEGILDNTW